MMVTSKGELAPGLHAVGPEWIPMFLFEGGEHPALFDAGFSAVGPIYEHVLKPRLAGRKAPYLFITHSHFDHCGAVAYLKEAFDGLKVAAEAQVASVWARPNARKLIRLLSEVAVGQVSSMTDEPVDDSPWRPVDLDLALNDGDEVDLGGGYTVQAIATPGHTRDTMSFFIPQSGVLIGSEAVGISHSEDYIFTEFLVSYDDYIASLERLAALDARVLCQGHGLSFVGREAVARRIRGAIDAAAKFRTWVLELLDKEDGDQQKVAQLVKAAEYDPLEGPKQGEEAYMLNLQAKVRTLAAI